MRGMLAALFLCCSLGMAAQAAPASMSDVACHPDGTQAEMTQCAIDEYENADLQLNMIYKQIMGERDKAAKASLRGDQRAWLKTMRASCKAEADEVAEGGSMWPLEYYDCIARETTKRTKVLKHL